MDRKSWLWIGLGAAVALALWFYRSTVTGQAITSEASAAVSNFLDRLRELIARFEGLSLTVYPDQAGNPTIGYGHLIVQGDPYAPYGTVTQITQDQAVAQLNTDTQEAQQCVSDSVSVDLTDDQRAALVSLVFNIGCGNFASSTLLKYVNAGNMDGAASEFAKWNHVRDASGNLVVSDGLTTRRAAEAALFTGVA